MKLIGILRPFVRLSRFRHRRGYGVHSPFAFNLITQVIYQKTPYYKYKELAEEEKRLAPYKDDRWLYESRKVKRLLFRLVNHARPSTIANAGTLSASSLYLQAARTDAKYMEVSSRDVIYNVRNKLDFLYLHDYRHPDFVEEVFRYCAERSTQKSLFVIEGIGYTAPMRRLWCRMVQDERSGITFDLYDLGLIFFDRTKTKQDYIVNF